MARLMPRLSKLDSKGTSDDRRVFKESQCRLHHLSRLYAGAVRARQRACLSQVQARRPHRITLVGAAALLETSMKSAPSRKTFSDFARKAGLSPFAIFLPLAIPTTLCAGCALFFAGGLFDASDPGVLSLALVALALVCGAIWKTVKALTKE